MEKNGDRWNVNRRVGHRLKGPKKRKHVLRIRGLSNRYEKRLKEEITLRCDKVPYLLYYVHLQNRVRFTSHGSSYFHNY